MQVAARASGIGPTGGEGQFEHRDGFGQSYKVRWSLASPSR